MIARRAGRTGAAHAATLAIALGVAAAGCANPTNLGSHDAAAQRDALVPCGATSCAGGTVCCNASCGICVVPGGTCIDIPCTDGGVTSCGADDATLSGGCPTTLYRWDGGACVRQTGCTCSGRDCERLRPTEGECFAEHDECWAHGCETSDGTCPAGHFCETSACGEGSGTCAREPTECAGYDPVVCGCDGAPYASACEARRAGVSHDDGIDCGACEARVPVVAGTCSLALGFAWDGGQCAVVRGCECTSGCDRLFSSLVACTMTRAPCLRFACGATECARWDEICVVDDVTGCAPLPGECKGVPRCECLDDFASCTEQGPGAYVATP